MALVATSTRTAQAGSTVAGTQGMLQAESFHLHQAVLSNFKSYLGAVVIGPFDASMTAIVGPNGSGKSCLVEGICFALGLQLGGTRSRSLASVVCHNSAGGECYAAVRFKNSGGSGWLVVQHRVVGGGRRSEMCVQQCACAQAGEEEASKPWVCCNCSHRQMPRAEMRCLVLSKLGIDIDRGEDFVVQQSSCTAIVSKRPAELLTFLEDVAGTSRLRVQIQEETKTAERLQAALEDGEAGLAETLALKRGKAGAMTALAKLDASQQRVSEMKASHMRGELRLLKAICAEHKAACRAAAEKLSDADAQCKDARRAAAQAREELTGALAAQQRGKTGVAKLFAERTALEVEAAKLQLAVKQAASLLRRKQKALSLTKSSLAQAREDGTAAQTQQSQAENELREDVRPAKADAEARLRVRAEEMERVQRGSGCSDAERRAVVLETELKARYEREYAAKQQAASSAASDGDALRARLGRQGSCQAGQSQARPGGADERLLAAKASDESTRRAVEAAQESAKRAQARTKVAAAAHAASKGEVEQLSMRTEECLARFVEAEASSRRDDKQRETSRLLQELDSFRHTHRLGAEVYGFLCHCFSVSEAAQRAVNVALGSSLSRTVVVKTKTVAIAIVGHFRKRSVGVVTCLIADELRAPSDQAAAAVAAGCVPMLRAVSFPTALAGVAGMVFGRWLIAESDQAALAASKGGEYNAVTHAGNSFLRSGEIRGGGRSNSGAGSGREQLLHLRRQPLVLAAPQPRARDTTARASPAAVEALREAWQKAVARLKDAESGEVDAAREHELASAASIEAADALAAARAVATECASALKELQALRSQRASTVEASDAAATDSASLTMKGSGSSDSPQRDALERELELLRSRLPAAKRCQPPWHQLFSELRILRDRAFQLERQMRLASEAALQATETSDTLGARRAGVEREVAEAELQSSKRKSEQAAVVVKQEELVRRIEAAEKNAAQISAGISGLQERKDDAAARVSVAERAVRAARAALQNQRKKHEAAQRATHEVESQCCEPVDNERGPSVTTAPNAARAAELLEARRIDCESMSNASGDGGDADAPPQTSEDRETLAASVTVSRTKLRAEEMLLEQQAKLIRRDDVQVYLEASVAVDKLEHECASSRASLRASLKQIECMQAERGRALLAKLQEVDARFRRVFRELCEHGDCCLEYASQPAVLFAEGVSIQARPPRSEWSRFDMLSGGQKSLLAVTLQLALQDPHSQRTCVFDEIDAALDAQRTRALAEHLKARAATQSIIVSHRPHLIQASAHLIGTYQLRGSSQAVRIRLRR